MDVPTGHPSVQVSWTHPKGSPRLSGHGDHQEKFLVLQWLKFLCWVSLPGLLWLLLLWHRACAPAPGDPDGIITPPRTTVKEIIS